ncbi:MAG: DUF1667 domain-containing protein [Clostridiaceae bacterium]|nr:DUF1667 domain-containing protein [Clostridiaceae bacterium]
MIRELVCINCPRGCHLKVNTDTLEVSGNTCPKGEQYALNEVKNPLRIVTTTVVVEGGNIKMLPVKTDKAIPKKLNFKCMELLKNVVVKAPVNVGDILIFNILGTDANIVACKKVLKH